MAIMVLLLPAIILLLVFGVCLVITGFFYLRRWWYLGRSPVAGIREQVKTVAGFLGEAGATSLLALLYPFGCRDGKLREQETGDRGQRERQKGAGQPLLVMIHGYGHNRSAFFFCAGA